jgi:hypothetical protein
MTKQKDIDGVTFQVAPFMAVEGLRLKAFLIKTLGPGLGALLGGLGDTKTLQDINNIKIDGTALAQGIEKLMENLGEDQFIGLIKRLFQNVVANWKESGKQRAIAFGNDFDAAMETVFLGRLFSVYPLIGFVLEVNYPDFFGKVVRGIGGRIKAIQTSEPEEQNLNDESGKSEK